MMSVKMNHILKFQILYLLTLSEAISAKPVQNAIGDDYQRYAYNQPIDLRDKEQFGYKEDQLNIDDNTYLEPHGNLRVVEYTTDDFSNGLNAIIQKLAASHSGHSHLFGPLPLPLPPINPLINPLHYGFGNEALPELPKVTVTGRSIPWDPKTHSFGGWKPLDGPVRRVPQAMLVTRKYLNGQLYTVKSKPISLVGKMIIIKREPID